MITMTSLPETLQVLLNHFLSQHWLVLEDILEVDTYVVSRGDLVRRFSRQSRTTILVVISFVVSRGVHLHFAH